MDSKRVRIKAAEDQYAAAARNAQGRVIVSVAEMEILVTLADIGLIAVLACSDTPHAELAVDNMARATAAWEHSQTDFIGAAAVCASVLQSERIAAFNTIREHMDTSGE